MSESTALAIQETALTVEEKRHAAQLEAIKQILLQRTPPKEIRERKGRGGMVFKYTDGAYVIRTLNDALGHNWDFEADNEEIINWNGVPFEVRCRGRLTVRMGEKVVTKVQYGSQAIEYSKDRSGNILAPVSIGDAFKGAGTDAMKKCASLLGVALDLYDSDYKPENYEGAIEIEKKAVRMEQQNGDSGAAIGGVYDRIGEILRRAEIEDSSASRRHAYGLLKNRKFLDAGIFMKVNPDELQKAFDYLSISTDTGPSKKLIQNRAHGPEVAKRFDDACKRLVALKIDGPEMLRETNSALHDLGLKQVKTRYELNDEAALIICQQFEKWADRLQREAVKDIGI